MGNNDSSVTFKCQRCKKILSKEELGMGTFFCFSCNDKKLLDKTGKEAVNHQEHYNKVGIECIDGIKSAMGDEAYKGFLKGNVMKYLWRYESKEKPLEDLKKAKWYLEKLIELLEK